MPGSDLLVFGPGIAVSDVLVQASSDALDLIVGVEGPRASGHRVRPTDRQDHAEELEESLSPRTASKFRFADGTTLNVGAAVGGYLMPFGATLSAQSGGGKLRYRHGGETLVASTCSRMRP